MRALVYRYNSICEPDVIMMLERSGVEVIEIQNEMTDKAFSGADRVHVLDAAIDKYSPLFVFTINFFPSVADVCHIHSILYISWSVDVPVLEYFSDSIKHETNRIFLFDRAQYERFHPYNQECIFYLPLAASVDRFDKVNREISSSDRKKFTHDISFVGSLYSEKNPLNIVEPSEYLKGYLDGILESQMRIYGANFLENVITDDCIELFKKELPQYFNICKSKLVENPEKYICAHSILGYALAEKERINTLNTLAQYFDVTLYTLSDTSVLRDVNVPGSAKSLSEMPKIFKLSKINLNMTMRAIQTGLPLRIFDILGCGGFLMTNYQEELTEFFDIGEDVEAYTSIEELVDKCMFYLVHDGEREKIAKAGYEKVRKYHTYELRFHSMLKLIQAGG